MSRPLLDGTRVAGLDAEALAQAFGTPLYVYDFDSIVDRVEALRAVLPPTFELAYAAKANPALAVLHVMGSLGLGLDIASGGELLAAERAGISLDRVVFTGPGKTDAELVAATKAGLRAITVESAGELARVERLAEETGVVTPVLLRMAMDASAESTPILQAGWRKFGIDPHELEAVARRAQASAWIDPIGIHAFAGSNVTDGDAVVAHIAQTMEVAADLARRAGLDLRLVDVGGGLGIPYDEDEVPLDLDRLGRRLAILAASWACDPAKADLPVLLEPGRFLVGPCGLLLTRVVDRKCVGGWEVVIVDSGIHHALRPSLVGPHRLRVICHGERRPTADSQVVVAGPLCTGLDVLPGGLDWLVEPGDLIAVLDLGAYGFTEAMPAFLSHPTPAEVAVSGERVTVVRPRTDPEALLDGQSLAWSRDADRGMS